LCQGITVALRRPASHQGDTLVLPWSLPAAGRSERNETDGHGFGLRADDAVHDLRAVAVVFGVVGGIDAAVGFRVGIGEDDVTFDAAGVDPAGAAGLGASVPRVVRPVRGADVQLVAGADDAGWPTAMTAIMIAKNLFEPPEQPSASS
jgi:hypothetical protein